MISPQCVGLVECGALPPSRPSADLLLATMAVTRGPARVVDVGPQSRQSVVRNPSPVSVARQAGT
jgi:hypothetical protein